MKKDPLVFVAHIQECIQDINTYTTGMDFETFLNNKMAQDAVVIKFEIIGEAAKNISTEFRELHANIPWKKMAGLRDKLIHQYMGVDLIAIWTTIEEVLPKLKSDLDKL
jgi:uncharacterized protein with HEPN domain